jgi:hypothetical protein
MGTVFYSFREALLLFHSSENLDNSIGNCPSQEVELGARGRQPLKLYPFRSAKRIKKLFTVPVKTGLVSHVYRKYLAARSRERHVVILGVVSHKPLQFAKRRAFTTANYVVKLFTILWNIKKFSQTREK